MKRKFSPQISIFESAIHAVGVQKDAIKSKTGAINEMIAELKRQASELTAEHVEAINAVTAEIMPLVESWSLVNEGSYLSELGKIFMVRAHTKRHWNVEKMDAYLDEHPEIAELLCAAECWEPIDIAFRMEIQPK